MRQIESFAVPAQATFGRDGAMFEGLLDFVAQLSLVLWGLVVLTVVIRFIGVGLYRRGASRRAPAAALAPSPMTPAAAVPASGAPAAASVSGQPADVGIHVGVIGAAGADKDAVVTPAELAEGGLADVLAADATFSDDLQPAQAPAAVAPSVQVPRRAFRARRTRRLSVLAANSTEG